eukprot:1909052-Prymnesium_polylepis.1
MLCDPGMLCVRALCGHAGRDALGCTGNAQMTRRRWRHWRRGGAALAVCLWAQGERPGVRRAELFSV